MNIDAINEVIQGLYRDHEELMTSGGTTLSNEITRTLELLPEGVVWAVTTPDPAVFVCSDDTMFVTVVDENRVTTTSEPLERGKITVALEWGGSSTDQHGNAFRDTTWKFGHVDHHDAERSMTGRVFRAPDGEHYDRREFFARHLATHAGWGPPPALDRLAAAF